MSDLTAPTLFGDPEIPRPRQPVDAAPSEPTFRRFHLNRHCQVCEARRWKTYRRTGEVLNQSWAKVSLTVPNALVLRFADNTVLAVKAGSTTLLCRSDGEDLGWNSVGTSTFHPTSREAVAA